MADFILERHNNRNYRPGLLLAIATIGIFFAWASLNEIDQFVRGYGRIIPASEKKLIQHLEGGIVAEILVHEGQQVEHGDQLFVIRNQDAASQAEEMRIRIRAARLRLKRLQAELVDYADFSYTEDETSEFPDIVVNELSQFRTRRQQFTEKIAVLDDQKRQKSLRLNDLSSQLKALQAERKTAADQLEINRKLRAAGAVSESKYLDTQSRVQSFDTRIAAIRNQIPIVKAERSEAENRIAEAREQRKTAVNEDIGEVSLEIRQLEERIKSSKDKVERRDVVSPAKGIINKLYIKTAGGVIQPGAALADLIPLDENLVVEAQVSTDDRGQIWPNLPVNVRITAYDYTRFGDIKGTLTSISADSFKTDQGQEYYTVKVDLKSETIGNEQPVIPGMTAEINIITGKRNILDYLLKPIRRVGLNALSER